MVGGKSKTARHALLAGAVQVALAAAAKEANVNWMNAAGGNFNTGANWSGNVPPGTADRAVFNLSNTYTTTFDVSPTTSELRVTAGNVSFITSGVPRTYMVSTTTTENLIQGGNLTLGPSAAA